MLPKSFPIAPLTTVYPVDGEIVQTNFGFELHELLFPLFSKPPVVVLFKQMLVFVQAICRNCEISNRWS